MKRCAAAVLVSLSALAGPAAAAECDLAQRECITFIPLGDLEGGAVRSEVAGLSWDGLVAVGTSVSSLAPAPGEAFQWSQADGIEGLGSLPDGSAQSRATCIHKTGFGSWIGGAASSEFSGANQLEAAVFATGEGTWEGLGFLGGGTQSMVYGLNSVGDMAVGSSTSTLSGTAQQQAATHDGLNWTALELPPENMARGAAYGVDTTGSVIVGDTASAASGANGREAFRWSADGIQSLGFLEGGASWSRARAIDAGGTVIVGSSKSQNAPSNTTEAFRWTDDEMLGLGDLEGGLFDSEALAVSSQGLVVVGRGTLAAGPRAFVWTPDAGIRPLREVFEELSGTDLGTWKLEEATAISFDGRIIAGNGRNPDNVPEAWILSLPEPGAPFAGLTALLALGGFARRRRTETQFDSGLAAPASGCGSIFVRTQPSEPRSNS